MVLPNGIEPSTLPLPRVHESYIRMHTLGAMFIIILIMHVYFAGRCNTMSGSAKTVATMWLLFPWPNRGGAI